MRNPTLVLVLKSGSHSKNTSVGSLCNPLSIQLYKLGWSMPPPSWLRWPRHRTRPFKGRHRYVSASHSCGWCHHGPSCGGPHCRQAHLGKHITGRGCVTGPHGQCYNGQCHNTSTTATTANVTTVQAAEAHAGCLCHSIAGLSATKNYVSPIRYLTVHSWWQLMPALLDTAPCELSKTAYIKLLFAA